VTPFGEKMRALRLERGLTLKEMAAGLQLSPAYLSALEHGKRGKPSAVLLHQICSYFQIIWDEAEELKELAGVSDPRVVVDTAGLSPRATLLANRLAARIGDLPAEAVERLLTELEKS
jgi:transcriptional regulator with XRE-family HTH domain